MTGSPLLYFALGGLGVAVAALVMVVLFGCRFSPTQRLAAKKITNILHAIWAFCAISFGTIAGVAYGWETHGWIGAIAVGFIGCFAGAFAAASPALLLQIFH
jgi:hypothetical protein